MDGVCGGDGQLLARLRAQPLGRPTQRQLGGGVLRAARLTGLHDLWHRVLCLHRHRVGQHAGHHGVRSGVGVGVLHHLIYGGAAGAGKPTAHVKLVG
eukprot:XP_001694364.1 predicted protein [Chlamydomonas reinhardtii]